MGVLSLDELGDALGRVEPAYLVAAIACHVAQGPLRALAWDAAITAAGAARTPSRRRPSVAACLRGHLVGRGLGAFAPSACAVAAKLEATRRCFPGPAPALALLAGALVPLCVVDTAVGAALSALALWRGPLGGASGDLGPVAPGAAATGVGVVAGLAAAVVLVVVVVAWRRLAACRRRVRGVAATLTPGLAILRRPAPFLRGVAAPLAVEHALRVGSVAAFCGAFGLGAAPMIVVTALAAGALGGAARSLVGVAGTRQAVLVLALGASGIAAPTVLAFAFGMPAIVGAVDLLCAAAVGAGPLRARLRPRAWDRRTARRLAPDDVPALAPGMIGS